MMEIPLSSVTLYNTKCWKVISRFNNLYYFNFNLLPIGTWETDISKVEATGDKTEISVVNLHPATTYHFRIVAENVVGLSKPSDPVTIITSEEGKI